MSNDIQPEIRFPGFTEDWEERKLSEMANFSKGNGYSKADLAEEGHPVILYGRLYTKYETIIENVDTFAELKEKSVISNGGEVIVPASGETPEDISRASVVDVSGVALGGDLNIIKTKSELDPIFLALTISNGSQQKEMTKRAQGKSVVHLHNSDLKEVNLLYPKLDEQVKIGSFFKKLDVSIALHQRKLDLLKETKKGFLQKMFPKNGAKVPEIRFPGFTGDWEERKLQEVLRERNNQQPQSTEYPLVSFTVENGVTPKTDRYEREQLVVGDKSSKKYKVTVLNDIVYNPANLKFGAISRNKYGNAVFSPIYITFLVNNDVTTPEFIEMFVTRNDFIKRALKYQQGTVYERQSVSPTDLLAMNVYLPGKSEQEKIGSFFQQLDETIALHQRKLDLLKETKKGFLQKMFV
ncbi:restriction endonuclease subunit S [Enterococcus hirae]|uniref:restriction endonuclease subunit S n=1 Tax=Enterococcus hirae TaxID=1354 RepID=UPI000FFCB48C|nr:restriction endonuclease subunit S [Enterococcus hirae]RXA89864.1 restriction endonuclease subunit S [Enterococcus hirae]